MKRIKEDIKNQTYHKIYLLYGDEDYLKKNYRDKLKVAVLSGSDEMNYTYFEGKDIDLMQLREMMDTLPFFSDYRIIILENSGLCKSASDLMDFLPDMPDSTVLVLVEKEVDKRNKLYKYINREGLAVEMGAMSGSDMKTWVGTILKKNNRVIRQSTVEYLLEQVDNSMVNVSNELDKLIAYTDGREEVTREDIDAVCSVQITGRIFQMMDAVAGQKKQEALHLYHDLLELRESPMSILYLLTRHFNIMLQVQTLGNSVGRDVIAKKVGVPPFAVGKYQSQSRQFKSAQLREMIGACVDTEYQFKRGNLGDQIGVEMLLVSFATKR